MAQESENAANPLQATVPPKYSEWRRVARVFFGRKLSVIGFVIVVTMILMAVLAPVIAPHDPYKTDLKSIREQPSWKHPLGTDQVGRDMLSRIMYGARISLLIGFISVFSSAVVGMTMGLVAGYFGGIVFAIIMRFTDVLMALPTIILVILIAGMVGGGIPVVIFAMFISSIAGQCRMMCGQALSVKNNDYVMVARAMGMSDFKIMLTQVFPNAVPPLLVGITMALGGVILAEAGLSYLNIGVKDPTPSWGLMVNTGQGYLLNNPLLSIAPGAAIMLIVFGFNMAGDGFRDAIDPRLRGAF